MKLIALAIDGLPLFAKGLNLTFFARQRVSVEDKEALYALNANALYLNPAVGFAGINASGKTSVLKAILFSIKLLNNEPINHIEQRDILGSAPKITFTIVFCYKQSLYELRTEVFREQDALLNLRYCIKTEALREKKILLTTSKKQLLDFSKAKCILTRSEKEPFLADDTSIMISFNREHKSHILIADVLDSTNFNSLLLLKEVPTQVLRLLDASIDYLKCHETKNGTQIELKFHNKEVIVCEPSDLFQTLSSGTIRGIRVLYAASQVLKTGGVFVVDEIENHFNKELVKTLLRLFLENDINTKGAVLFFSTHSPELLDIFDRNDALFRMHNDSGVLIATAFSELLNRNDVKKSVMYESGALGKTALSYDAYMEFKKHLSEVCYEEQSENSTH